MLMSIFFLCGKGCLFRQNSVLIFYINISQKKILKPSTGAIIVYLVDCSSATPETLGPEISFASCWLIKLIENAIVCSLAL